MPNKKSKAKRNEDQVKWTQCIKSNETPTQKIQQGNMNTRHNTVL